MCGDSGLAATMSALWQVTVSAERCAGSGLCAGIAPAHFDLAGARSRGPATPIGPDDDVLAAAECCPMEAISIAEASSGAPVFGVVAEGA